MLRLCLSVFSFLLATFLHPVENKRDKLEVHLLPHSHNDVGWLKTVEEYYRGHNPEIQIANVRKILFSVLSDLSSLNNHTFSYAEMAFFSKWYDSLDRASALAVKKLLFIGKFEFVSGGWVMNDEASADYADIILQMSQGRRYIVSRFGSRHLPNASWQIDPFGHSQTMAAIFQAMGYTTVYLGRMSDRLRNNLRVSGQSYFLWNIDKPMIPLKYVGESSSIPTIVLPNNYSPPDGFCFDSECGDDELVDNPEMPNYNLEGKSMQFAEFARLYASYYASSKIAPMTMSNDFNYMVSSKWFSNLDKFIEYFKNPNEYINLKMKYSSPESMADAMKSASGQETLHTHYGDFLPYNDGPRSFWSGFYSSRPSLKAYIRECSWLHTVATQLSFFIPAINETTHNFARAISMAQHHDAITGTAKQHVVNDYVKILWQERDKLMVNAIPDMMNQHFKTIQDPFYCNYLNVSYCPSLNHQEDYHVFIYNPHGKNHEFCLRVPVKNSTYGVFFPGGSSIPSAVLDVDDSSYNPPYFRDHHKYNLHFCLALPSTRFTTVHVKISEETVGRDEKAYDFFKLSSSMEKVILNTKDIVTDYYIIHLDQTTNLVQSITSKIVSGGENLLQFNVNFGYYYYSSVPNYSGAYIFRPIEETQVPVQGPTPCGDSEEIHSEVVDGGSKVVTEIRTRYGKFCYQTLRIWQNSPFIEVEYTVGPLPIESKKGDDRYPSGMEAIFRMDTDIESAQTFYTDSNGRGFMKRQLNADIDAPISSNYYPITRHAALREPQSSIGSTSSRGILMVTDRSVGVSSLKNGSLEAMLLRRMSTDDARCMNEALNEQDGHQKTGAVTRGKMWLAFGDVESTTKLANHDSSFLYTPPLLMFSDYVGFDRWPDSVSKKNAFGQFPHQLLTQELPEHIRLFSFEILPANTYNVEKPSKNMLILLRLEHELSLDEPQTVKAPPVNMPLINLIDEKFSGHHAIKLDCIVEMFLAGDVPIGHSKYNDQERSLPENRQCITDTTISAGEIRTFLFEYVLVQ